MLDDGEETGYSEFLLEGKRPRTAEWAESVRAGTRPERMETDRSEEAGENEDLPSSSRRDPAGRGGGGRSIALGSEGLSTHKGLR